MKEGLSVIIPSRNEKYLEPTIRNVLANARGDIEILVALDGWLPDPQIDIGDNRVIFFYEPESLGQRQSINKLARIAKGKYVMKLDAHCAVDEGFDVKLAKDCEYDWTVIPRMYNLDINTFKPKWHKRTDYMYMRIRPNGQFRAEYFTGNRYRKEHLKKDLIGDVMCCMGPCFYMHKDRFWELGGCDEEHGGWGSQGIEVSCKAWLSGGALKVNKKTWFAHWFRGGGGPGFPYKLSGKQVSHSRKYAKDLWINNKWPLATRKFEFLLKKFNPPGWENFNMKLEPYKPRNAKSHVHEKAASVENLFQNLEFYWDPKRKHRAKPFKESAVPFFTALAEGKHFTDKELKAHPYYNYLASGLKTNEPMNLIKDGISLFNDIKKNGLKRPVEVWVDNGKYNISRGTRRIVILRALGTQWVAVRIYKDEFYMEKLRFKTWAPGVIAKTAEKQFQRWGWKATDKYWLHDYTPLYDRHCGHIIDIPNAKVLEVGVKRGGSIALWQEAFPEAHVFGVDIDLKPARRVKDLPRVTLLEGSQTDEEFNRNEVVPKGPFDLIVDDASHIAEHQRKGFEYLWGSVKPGGWYVVEDLYYRNYARGKRRDNMVAKLKELIDELNENCEIEALHFYYNIVFIQKRLEGAL